MEERKVMELTEKSEVQITDQFIIEDEDGTKLGSIASLKKIMINNLIFKTVEEMKSASLREGEVCITLGYNTENDGGGATYSIEYAPSLVEDKANVHYLYTSDTLRAVFVSDGTVTPEQFGAFGDGSRDAYKAIMMCMNSSYDVRFIRAHKYRLSTPIPVTSNTYLDFNGCTLIPSYCDAIAKPYSDAEDPIENVTIKNVTIDLENGSNGIDIQHPVRNLNMNDIVINNTKLYGIRLGSVYGGYLSNSFINRYQGNTSCIGIGIDGNVYTTDQNTSFSISDCSFSGMNPALSINTIGNTLSLNIHNCHYTHDTVASSYKNVVRLVGGAIRASIDSVDAVNLDTLFIVTTESYMNISNITMNGCNSLVDDLANTAVITIGNNIVITNPVSGAQAIIHRMYGKLINNNPNIVHPSSQSITSTDFVEYSGDLIDSCDPMSYDIENVTGSNGTIRVTGISNKYFNITGTSNITTIEGGMNGQRILLKASSNISIVASTEITLQSSTVTIGPYNSIELKRIANDWVQIK